MHSKHVFCPISRIFHKKTGLLLRREGGKPVSQNINPNLTFNHKTYLVMDLKSAVCCLIDLSAASLSMEEAPKKPLISGIFSII